MKNKQAHSPRSGNARARRRDLRQAATGLATASVLAVGLPAATALAGTGSCVGSGAIEVSDPRIGECQLQSGFDVGASFARKVLDCLHQFQRLISTDLVGNQTWLARERNQRHLITRVQLCSKQPKGAADRLPAIHAFHRA